MDKVSHKYFKHLFCVTSSKGTFNSSKQIWLRNQWFKNKKTRGRKGGGVSAKKSVTYYWNGPLNIFTPYSVISLVCISTEYFFSSVYLSRYYTHTFTHTYTHTLSFTHTQTHVYTHTILLLHTHSKSTHTFQSKFYSILKKSVTSIWKQKILKIFFPIRFFFLLWQLIRNKQKPRSKSNLETKAQISFFFRSNFEIRNKPEKKFLSKF